MTDGWLDDEQNNSLLKSPVFHIPVILYCDAFLLTYFSLLNLVGDEVMSSYTQQKYEVLDVGIMHPGEVSTGAL